MLFVSGTQSSEGTYQVCRQQHCCRKLASELTSSLRYSTIEIFPRELLPL